MMIDSSIAMGVQPVKVENPLNALAQFMQIKQAQQQGELGQMKMDEYQRGVKSQNSLRDYFKTGDQSSPEFAQGLGAIDPKFMQDWQKHQLDQGETRAKTEHLGAQSGKLNAETLNLHMQQHRDALGSVNDPQSAAAWVAAGYQNPEFAPLVKMSGRTLEQSIAAIPQTPQEFQQWKMQNSLGADKLIQMTRPDANAQLASNTSIQNNQASNATTMRGQNMTDARSREATSATMSKPFEVTGPDGQPVLVQQGKNGAITPVSGFGPKAVDKPLTEGQSKAALFGSRMQNADKIMGELASGGTTTSQPGSRAGFGIGTVVNMASSANQQKLDQAKRDFVNAVLRRESGASISSSEFDNAERQYFPQIGDTTEVQQQKANNRAISVRGMQAEIPKAQRGVVNDIIGNQEPAGKTVVRTGTMNGRTVHQYSDGTTDYAN